jgi:solute carrier family 35 protein F1/2
MTDKKVYKVIKKDFFLFSIIAQSFLTYCLLCIIFTTWLAFKPANKGLFYVLRVRGWKYFLLSIIDVEANFVLVKAFQFTTLTSIQVSINYMYEILNSNKN